TLIDWFPCRFDCAHSLAAARRVEWALSWLAPHLLPSIRDRMETTVFQIDNEGTLFFRRDGRRVLPENADGPAARALRCGTPVRRADPGHLVIGDRRFAGSMAAFTSDEPQCEGDAA